MYSCVFEFSVADQVYYQERGYTDPVRFVVRAVAVAAS